MQANRGEVVGGGCLKAFYVDVPHACAASLAAASTCAHETSPRVSVRQSAVLSTDWPPHLNGVDHAKAPETAATISLETPA